MRCAVYTRQSVKRPSDDPLRGNSLGDLQGAGHVAAPPGGFVWGYLVKQDGAFLPTRASVALFRAQHWRPAIEQSLTEMPLYANEDCQES